MVDVPENVVQACSAASAELDAAGPAWRKSSLSSTNPNSCVEVARRDSCVHVRDSKHREGGLLAFEPRAWKAFVDGLCSGRMLDF
ncbi:hypothetical protein BC739_002820 [Kutzneria viridogrisea]|uniref:DUF397 domain-containing protein n=1 Tax=Kutzneria viridogrisea TaxID=47990 RepID=A0ABR6BFG1_9PSEU|nr:DUF397 domain-containing protein [Kutzneria albida]MBA8925621.1 hypothetical protein [Kutzneria viridogrisea]